MSAEARYLATTELRSIFSLATSINILPLRGELNVFEVTVSPQNYPTTPTFSFSLALWPLWYTCRLPERLEANAPKCLGTTFPAMEISAKF